MRKDWSKASLVASVEYIEQHHCVIMDKLMKLQALLETAGAADKAGGGPIGSLRDFCVVLKNALEKHFAKEENTLFPYIRQMDAFNRKGGPEPEFFGQGGLKNPISQLEHDHDQVENVMFARLKGITGARDVAHGPCGALKPVYECLADIETDIRKHIHLEQKILFPSAIELELQAKYK